MNQKNDKMLSVDDTVFVLLESLKSNGTFDEFRRDCVSNIDAKVNYYFNYFIFIILCMYK